MNDILDECFAQFTTSAVRLETLQSYSVAGEAERIAAWRAGRPRPERSVRTSAYLREVAEHVIAGRQRVRIRVVDHPLPEYIRYQLNGYVETQAAGEEIDIAVRAGGSPLAKRDLAALPGDFWLFDQNLATARAVWLYYSEEGHPTGSRLATGPELDECREAWDTASRHCMPLNEYLAALHASVAVA